MKIKIILWLFYILVMIAPVYPTYYGNCPYGNFPYGHGCAISINPPSGGGGNNLITYPFTGEISFNGTCQEKQQLYENRCYPCDPSIGYLDFDANTRSLYCVKCPTNFFLNGTNCLPILKNMTSIEKIKLEMINKADNIANDISSTFKTKNLLIGYFFLFIALVIGIYYGYEWLMDKNKKKKEEKVSDEEDDS